jgi:hypothetical protein
VGVQPRPDRESEEIFTTLVDRNAINMHAPEHAAVVFDPRQSGEMVDDSLPALLTRTLELIASRRGGRGRNSRQRLVAIVNNGFPEAEQNAIALRICRRFASETGFEWAGGLALGGGEAINGRPLTDVKGMARNAISSLDLAADALAAGKPIPDRAVRLMAKPIIWSRLYTWIGTRGWRRRAATHGVADRLDDRPYQP